MNLLSVETIAVTILGYPLSYLELIGTFFNIASVWLVARNRIATWPVGIIGVVLFMLLFYQINLYADFFEQIYYLITGFWGWYMWSRGNRRDADGKVSNISPLARWWYGVAVALGTLSLGWVMAHLHGLLPMLFVEPASYPLLDSFTTVLSFAATILMMRRKVECWYLWITVDVIGIWLYAAKGVVFVSLLYVVFLILAIQGLRQWRRTWREFQPVVAEVAV